MIIDMHGREFVNMQHKNQYHTSKTAVFICIAVRLVFNHIDAPFQIWSAENTLGVKNHD